MNKALVHKKAHFKGVIPCLRVNDIHKTLDFYQNALGFKAIKEHNNLASVQRDEVVIEFRRSHKACGRSEAEFNQNRDLDIEVQEIEALYNQLEKKNVRIINSISKDRLGHKNFQIVDCNGYVIVFTQRHTDK